MEAKVVGVAVKAFVKLDGGAAQPVYVPAAPAGVSAATKIVKTKTPEAS
jgi:hypothetical protein